MVDNVIQERLLVNPEAEQEGNNLKIRVYEESKKIWRIALPTVISKVCAFGAIVVTQAFIGHVSSVDLAGYALVQTLGVRFMTGILIGMSSATETLCGQAYGAKQYHMMGVYLQRSWLIDLITMTLFTPAFVFGASIFKLLGQVETMANSAGHIALWFIPVCYSSVFNFTIQMYLQAQQKNMIIAWMSIVQIVIHVLLSWLLVYVLDYGVDGAMAALVISSWVSVLGQFVYIFCGWCPDSWKGFSMATFKDLFPLVKLSIGSGLMICLDVWYNSILILVAGYMENAEVAVSAFSICLNVSGWALMVFLGMLGAACVRVANELGRGDAEAVRFSIKVVLTTSVIIGLLFSILCLVFGKNLGYLFTNNDEVARTVSNLSFLLASTVFLSSIYPVFSGVAIGAGLQTTVAIVNFVCFYLIGLTTGVVLAYVTPLRVTGLWIGLTIGVLPAVLAMSFITWRTDWDEKVEKASARLKKWYLKSPSEGTSDEFGKLELS